jgi:guanylate kinase
MSAFSTDRLVLLCGPSGSGKTTIVHHLLKMFPNMSFSISATTRPMRANETDGVDYHFLTPNQFREKIAAGEFLEWEEVYHDRFYGTLKEDVYSMLKQDKIALFDVDVEGGLQIRKHFGRKLLDVFVMPPSVDELHRRLVARASETEDSLRKRLDKAEKEMQYAYRFNNIIVNTVQIDACNEAVKLVQQFLNDDIPESPEDVVEEQ